MELNERLQKAREHAGHKNPTEAAAALRVKYPTYAGHENGSSGFRAATGAFYAKKFKVRFDWLMNENGPMVSDEADPEQQLRSALIAFGVDRDDLGRAVSAVRVFLDDPDEQSSRGLPDDQSEPANPRRAKEPT